ncbi:hypothetical protein QP027_03275 [Corynebacterium breve]|uniref:ABC transporter permease n=1 Tax=Corynebacterium breve TaxID=3049799 RepID=A0ABY8VJN0_9CORY|nr:hypothetical protein [Corynebacterium breve]WIM68433.1 hypothetical protein QP027_03275 [Corynebacterium breve]
MSISFRPSWTSAGQLYIPANLAMVFFTALIIAAWVLTSTDIDTILTAVTGVIVLGLGIIAAIYSVLRWGRDSSSIMQLMATISPTALLMTTFPLIMDELIVAGHQNLVLAVAVTVPWITSAATLPIYAPLTSTDRSDVHAFYRDFYRVFPSVAMWAMLAVGGFTLFVLAAADFTPGQLGIYVVGLIANILFALFTVPPQETHKYTEVFLGWVLYASWMLFVPELWVLAPLLGCIPGLVQSRSGLSGLLQPMEINQKMALRQMGYGLLYGGILWADKFLLIFFFRDQIDVVAIYVALIPVVIAQSAYFASQYVVFRRCIDSMYGLVEKLPYQRFEDHTMDFFRDVDRALMRTLSIAGLSGFGLILTFPALGYPPTLLTLAFVIAPVWLLALTLQVYQVNQLKGESQPAMFSAIHLITTFVAIPAFSPAVAMCLIVIVDIALVVWATGKLKGAFEDAAYELFWSRAVTW